MPTVNWRYSFLDVVIFLHVVEDQQPTLAMLLKPSMKGCIAHVALDVREWFLETVDLHESHYVVLDSDLTGSVDPDCSIVFLWYSGRIQVLVSVFDKDLRLASTTCAVNYRSFLTALRLCCVDVIIVKKVSESDNVSALSNEATA